MKAYILKINFNQWLYKILANNTIISIDKEKEKALNNNNKISIKKFKKKRKNKKYSSKNTIKI